MTPAVSQRLGDVCRSVEDVGHGKIETPGSGDGAERPERHRVEARDQNPVSKPILTDQVRDLSAKLPVDLAGFDLQLNVIDETAAE